MFQTFIHLILGFMNDYLKEKREMLKEKVQARRYIIEGERRIVMVFNTGAALLDAIVLAVVSKEEGGTYGYKITQQVRQVIELSESTLYPVLRRLQKYGFLEVYDMECGGRNRRYYKLTISGSTQLDMYKKEWKEYAGKINGMFEGGAIYE